MSTSGTRDCLLEDYQANASNCAGNPISGDYVERYTGVARAGYQFRRWGTYCADVVNNECSIDVSAAVVTMFNGFKAPPLQAVFRPTKNTGFTALFMGDEFFPPLAEGIAVHAQNAGFIDHSSTVFSAIGDQGAPQAFWDNGPERTAIQTVLDAGDVELFGMTYSSKYPAVLGYHLWINYALARNPDTRFLIAMPWSTDPGTVTPEEYQTEYESTLVPAVHALIDKLRNRYPGVDFYSVPYGGSAVELYNLYDASALTGVTDLIGPVENSVFSNAAGQPGHILSALGQLVSLGAIYDLDVTGYDYDPGTIIDLKALAQNIIDTHDEKYQAPDEIDIDTDGDGIWDRLDPNPSGKLNVLLIIADDLGFNDLAINNGNTNIDTPTMDQIATEGVRFTRHYASAVCSPGRAALLTGMYPERLGYMPNSRGIPTEVVTFPDALQAEGYTTWHIGKWHVGDIQRTAWPDYQGFDHWFGFLNQWRLAGTQSGGEVTLDRPRYDNPYLEGDTDPGKNHVGHLEDILTDKTMKVLTDLREARKPWFINLAYYAPHAPIQPSAEFAALYPDTEKGRYRALVNQLDTNIGRVVDHLDALGMSEETVVVVVSDNGGTEKQIDNNTPYLGKKATITEGGLRTPLIIKWPDHSINGQVFDDTIAIKDIYPTVLEALGVSEPPNLDGVSYYRSLQFLEAAPRRDLFWEFGGQSESYGVLTSRSRWRLYQPFPFWDAMRNLQLYDFRIDSTASIPVVPAQLAQVARMRTSFASWYEDVHTVATVYTPGSNGGGVLTGMNFMRTPGEGWYTFGIGVPDELDGQIVSQAGVWSMNRSANTVTVELGAITLSGDILDSYDCHSVVVTGNFKRRWSNAKSPPKITLAMYIDGVETESVEVETALIVPDPTVPTIIGDPAIPAGNGVIRPPIVLNTELTDTTTKTLSSFSDEVCPTS